MRISPVGSDFESVSRNYSLSNKSQVSSVYQKEKVQSAGSAGKVDAVSPVVYPNADVKAVSQVDKAQEAVEAENSFNAVASKFQGAMTAYNMDAVASSYGMSGSTINLLA
ncbi:MAG: hypothetical protein MJ110_01525 [Lachnospiraceae bacterium]|nr:hypothetical protein [Lachnospiraceae bacterium]